MTDSPTMVAQWAPGFDPRSPSPVFVDLPRIVSLNINRGRQGEFGQMEPGTCVVVLGGNPAIDDVLDPLDPESVTGVDALPLTPFRVMATFESTNYRIFTGFIDGDAFTPVGPVRGQHSPVRVKAVDWLGWAAQASLPGSRWSYACLGNTPLIFIPGELNQNPAVTGDVAFDLAAPNDAVVTTAATTPGSLFEASSIVPGGTFPSLSFTTSGASTERPYVRQVTPIDPVTNSQCTVAFWLKTAAGVTTRILVRLLSGTLAQVTVGVIGLDATGHPYAEMRSATGNVLATATITTLNADTDQPVLLIATWDRATRTVAIRMRTSTGFFPVATSAATGTATLGIGGSTIGIRDNLSGPVMTIGEFALFDHIPTELIATTDGNYTGYDGPTLWNGQTIEDRLTRLFTVAGVDVDTAGALSNHLITITGDEATLAGELNAYTDAFAGVAFVSPAGDLNLLVPDDLEASPYDTATFAISDAPDGHVGYTTIRPTDRSRTGHRMSRVINHVDMGYSQYVQPYAVRARDVVSERRYGRQTFAPGALAQLKSEVASIPQAIIDRFGRPGVEIEPVEIRPYGDRDAILFVLGTASNLLRLVRYVETKRGSTTFRVIDALMRIQHESFSWSDGTHWWVRYKLAADDPIVSYPSPLSIPWDTVCWAEDPDWDHPANGDPVSSWHDSGTTGVPFVGTGTSRPVYVASEPAVGGRPALRFDGTDDRLVQTGATHPQPGTVVIISAVESGGRDVIDGTPTTARWLIDSNAGVWRWQAGSGLTSNLTVDSDAHFHHVHFNGASSSMQIDTLTLVGDLGTQSLTDAKLMNTSATYTAGAVVFVGIIHRALTTDELAWLMEWAKYHYELPAPEVTPFLAFDGDSLTQRADGGGTTLPQHVAAALGSSVTSGNYATGGHSVDEVAAGVSVIPVSPRRIYIIWAGTNDIFDGDGGASAATKLAALCAGQQAKGDEVVVVTCIPSDTVGHEAERQILNAAIRADWPTYADALVDLDAVSQIFPAGSAANPGHYIDQTHLNDAGRTAITPVFLAALATLDPPIVP